MTLEGFVDCEPNVLGILTKIKNELLLTQHLSISFIITHVDIELCIKYDWIVAIRCGYPPEGIELIQLGHHSILSAKATEIIPIFTFKLC